MYQSVQPALGNLGLAGFVGLRRRTILIAAGAAVIGVLPPTSAWAEQIVTGADSRAKTLLGSLHTAAAKA